MTNGSNAGKENAKNELALIVTIQRLRSADNPGTDGGPKRLAFSLNLSLTWKGEDEARAKELAWVLAPWLWRDSKDDIGPLVDLEVFVDADGPVGEKALAWPDAGALEVARAPVLKAIPKNSIASYDPLWNGEPEGDDPEKNVPETGKLADRPFRRVLGALSQLSAPTGQALGLAAYFYVDETLVESGSKVRVFPDIVIADLVADGNEVTFVPKELDSAAQPETCSYELTTGTDPGFTVTGYTIPWTEGQQHADGHFDLDSMWVKHPRTAGYATVGDEWTTRFRTRFAAFFDLSARLIEAVRSIAREAGTGPTEIAQACVTLRRPLRSAFLVTLRDLAFTGIDIDAAGIEARPAPAWSLAAIILRAVTERSATGESVLERLNGELRKVEDPASMKAEAWFADLAGRLPPALAEVVRNAFLSTESDEADPEKKKDASRPPAGSLSEVLHAEADLWASIHEVVRDEVVVRALVLAQWDAAAKDVGEWTALRPKVVEVLASSALRSRLESIRARRIYAEFWETGKQTLEELEGRLANLASTYCIGRLRGEGKHWHFAPPVPDELLQRPPEDPLPIQYDFLVRKLAERLALQARAFVIREVPRRPSGTFDHDDARAPATQTAHAVTVRVIDAARFGDASAGASNDVLGHVAGIGLLARPMDAAEWKMLNAAEPGLEVWNADSEEWEPDKLVDVAAAPRTLGYEDGVRTTSIVYDNQPIVASTPAARLVLRHEQVLGGIDPLEVPWRRRYQVCGKGEPWRSLPALRFGTNFEFAPYLVGNAGGLPRALLRRESKDGLILHPACLESQQLAQKALASEDLKALVRTVSYRRRVPIGPPRIFDPRPAGKAGVTDLFPAIPSAVSPLVRELVLPDWLAEPGDVAWRATDAVHRNGLIRADLTVPTEVALRFSSLRCGVSVTLVRLVEGSAEDVASIGLSLSKELPREIAWTAGDQSGSKQISGAEWTLGLELGAAPAEDDGEALRTLDVRIDAGDRVIRLAVEIEREARLALRLDRDASGEKPMPFHEPVVSPSSALLDDPARPGTALCMLWREFPAKGSSAILHVALPSVDLPTLDRWCKPSADTKSKRDELTTDQRVQLWATHARRTDVPVDPGAPAPATERSVSLDDPAALPRLHVEIFPVWPALDEPFAKTFVFPGDDDEQDAWERFHRPELGVDVRRVLGPTVPDAHLEGQTLVIELPSAASEPSILEVRLSTVVSLDAVRHRCAEWMERGLRRSASLDVPEAASPRIAGDLRFLVELPSRPEPSWFPPADLRRCLRAKQEGDEVLVSFSADEEFAARLRLVSEVEIRRQMWRWDGRPLIASPFAVVESEKPGSEEYDRKLSRGWDPVGFASRADDVYVAHPAHVSAMDLGTTLFRYDLRSDPRAWYHRYGVKVRHRYAALYAEDPGLQPEVVAASEEAEKYVDRWRRLLLRAQPPVDVPKPLARMVVPLTSADDDETSPAALAGFLVLLREPWFERFGLADTFVAEIERTAGFFARGPDDPDPERLDLPQFGPDPLLTGLGWRDEDDDEPTAANKALWASGPVFTRGAIQGPVGHTFEPDAPSSLFVTASFLVGTPSFGDAQRDLRWHFARLRFRRRLELAATRPVAGPIERELSARTREDARLLAVLDTPPYHEAPYDLVDLEPPPPVSFAGKWIDLIDEPKSNGAVEATFDVEIPGIHVRAARVLAVWSGGTAKFDVYDALGNPVPPQGGAAGSVGRKDGEGEKALGVWVAIQAVAENAGNKKVDLELAVAWVRADGKGKQPDGIRRYRISGVELVPDDGSAPITFFVGTQETQLEGWRPPRVSLVDGHGLALAESQAVASQWMQLVPGNEVRIPDDAGLSRQSGELVIEGTIAPPPVRASQGEAHPRAVLQWIALLTRRIHDAAGRFGAAEAFVALCTVRSDPATERIVVRPTSSAAAIENGDPLSIRFLQVLLRGPLPDHLDPDLWKEFFPEDAVHDRETDVKEASDALMTPRSVSRRHDLRSEPWRRSAVELTRSFAQLPPKSTPSSRQFTEILAKIFPLADLREADGDWKPMRKIRSILEESPWRLVGGADLEALQSAARQGTPIVALSSIKPPNLDARRIALVLPSLTHRGPSGTQLDVLLLDPEIPMDSGFGVPLKSKPGEQFTFYSRRVLA